MKKITMFIVVFLLFKVASAQEAQGNGFIRINHSNNINTDGRDAKTFSWETMGRYPIVNNILVFGYVQGNDTLYNLTAGISFKPRKNLRFDIGSGAEFLEVQEQSDRQISPVFVFRGYLGDNYQENNLWVNMLSGTRVWWQAIYSHQFTNWIAAGLIAEDKKGAGIRVELSLLSYDHGINIFSNIFYNGENETKKLGFDAIVDIGILLIF